MAKKEDYKSEAQQEIKNCKERNSDYVAFCDTIIFVPTEERTYRMENQDIHILIDQEELRSQRDSLVNLYGENTKYLTNL